MLRILVADKIAECGLERLRRAEGVRFDVRHGLTPAELADVVGAYDGVLIRSSVQLTKEVFRHAGRLTAVARAGVGVDNVDIEAATAAGVLVMNTPDANTISTAEHTIAMIMALHRHLPDAHVHVVGGEWNRSRFQGEQLAGRTLGIVGLGRIGRAVARRALGLEMKCIAYDPFVAGESALEGRVALAASMAELLGSADCVTLHASLSDDNRHMIGAAELACMRSSARLVNCARGALIDEVALAAALNEGRLAGAAIDVFEHEPPVGSPLLGARNVVLTPHLAASTIEAQDRVSLDAVEALLAYLLRGEVCSAVNVTDLPAAFSARGRAFMDLCARLARVLSCWCAGGVERIRTTVFGESLSDLAGTLSWQALVHVVGPHLDERISLVNAKVHAAARGIVVEHAARSARAHWPEALALSVAARGQTHEIVGTVFEDGKPRILAIDGYPMEMVPDRSLVLIFNDDRPGVIGLVGQRFGEAGINIADMALSRQGTTALMVLKLDEPMPAGLRETLRSASPPILSLHTTTLPVLTDEATGA